MMYECRPMVAAEVALDPSRCSCPGCQIDAIQGFAVSSLSHCQVSEDDASGRTLLGRSDGLLRFGFAYWRQVDRPLTIVVGGSGGDNAPKG
jgi:hypothetical protein